MAATGISWVVQSKDGPYFWEPSTGKTFCDAPANAQNWHATATTGGTAFVNEQSGEEKLNLEELPKPSVVFWEASLIPSKYRQAEHKLKEEFAE